ncbi:MAG TPA: HAD-IA family hydrolase [Candidatus Limnocylindrales bacterium]|nr:HAD-IA family hydrolase [Candidatus Limnocylindrales bacterium]
MKSYKAVLFDAGNTLLYTSPSVAEIYHIVAKEYGCSASIEDVREAAKKVYKEFDAAFLQANSEYRHSDEEDRRRWALLIKSTFQQVGFDRCLDEITEKLLETFRNPAIWRLFPEVMEVLQRLKSEGYKLGIVSNWSSALLDLCTALELEPHLDITLVSAVVGWEKPSPFIFQKALSLLEVSPEEAIHIGDSYHHDILGAQSVGIRAVLIDRLGTSNHSCPRIKDLRELYSLLT